jgi:hypothetical protein
MSTSHKIEKAAYYNFVPSSNNKVLHNSLSDNHPAKLDARKRRNSYVNFFDIDGNFLHAEQCFLNDETILKGNRFEKMLDKHYVTKIRPTKLVIDLHPYHPDLGVCLYFYHENNVRIAWEKYNGPYNSLKKLVKYQRINPNATKVDYDWILKNDVKFIVTPGIKKYKNKCIIL